MKNLTKMKLIVISLLGIIIYPATVLAIGQMTQPIVVKNAAKGQTITETLTLFNSDKEAKEFGLIAEGDIATWVQFYKVGDLKTPITSIAIPAQGKINAIVVLTVPVGANNGTYKGEVSVTSAPVAASNTNESSVTAVQKIGRPVTITITGKEEIGAEVSVIPVSYAIDSGKTLSVRFIYYNTGNVNITPQVQVKIKDIDQAGVIATTIYPYPEDKPAVKPLERVENPAVEVSTSNLSDGKYWAFVTVTEKGQTLYDNKFRFEIGNNGSVLGTTFSNVLGGKSSLPYLIPIILLVVVAAIIVGVKLKRKSA